MKKILFISNTKIDGMMLSYLMPYKTNRGTIHIEPSDTPQIPISRWYEKEAQSIENVEKFYNFKFENYDIDFKFVEGNYEQIDLYENFAKEQKQLNGYNKIYLFIRRLFTEDITHSDFLKIDKNLIEIIYINVSEALHLKDSTMRNFLNENKVISCGNFRYSHKNFIYEPFINLLYSYYQYGFDYYPYNYLEVKKQNLIGLYLKRNYKTNRDTLYNNVLEIFKTNNIESSLLKIYKQESIPDFFTKFNCLHSMAWDMNCHITSYLDYITSVCGFVFETTNYDEFKFPYNTTNREYITEKTLKAILYSKMDIPFIIDMNPYTFLEFHNMGFWCLNSEFFDFNKINFLDELSENMKNSIYKSIDYILNLYIENDGDLNKIHLEIKKLYSDKMQNNFNQFMMYLIQPQNSDKILKFILE